MKFNLYIIFILSFLLFSIDCKSQSMQISDIQACSNDTSDISINMSTLNNLGAITLYISYDTTKLKFINLININPLASGTIFNDMHSGTGNSGQLLGKIAVSWVTSSSAVNFPQGVFAKLKFKILGGNSSLNFLNNCEIADYQSQIINTAFINGNITVPQTPAVLIQPSYNIVNSQLAMVFVSEQFSSTIVWQMKYGNQWSDIQNNSDFQGIDNDTLIINNINAIQNGTYFRCRLSNFCALVYSDSISLITTTASNGHNNEILVYPNPFKNIIYLKNIDFEMVEEIRLIQTDGKLLRKIKNFENDQVISINNLNVISKGSYFVEILLKDKSRRLIAKLIKN